MYIYNYELRNREYYYIQLYDTQKNGYNITFCSMIDGPLKALLEKDNIPLIIDNNMQLSVMTEEEWTFSYDLIVCNTLNFHVFLSDRNISIPCIWWLHDAAFFYDGVDKEIINRIDLNNLYTYSVGPIPRKAVREWIPKLEVKTLLYSVVDENDGVDLPIGSTGKMIFLLIGFLEEIKGQDLLIDVIEDIHESIQDEIASKAVRKSTLKSLKVKKASRLRQLKRDYQKAVQEVNILYAEDPERLKAKYAAADFAKTEKKKKPFYKRWWFWLIVVVVCFELIGICLGDSDSPEVQISTSSSTKDSANIEKTQLNEDTQISKGDKVTVKDVCEFNIDYINITSDVLPPNQDNWYTHYEAEIGKKYVDICIAYKNLCDRAVDADEVGGIFLSYANKYHYTGFSIIEEDNRSDLASSNIRSIDPLNIAYLHYLIEIPKEAADGTESLVATLTVQSNSYIIKVR